MQEENRFQLEDEFHFKTAEEMIETFSFLPEAIENTTKIAQRCNVDIELGKILLPKFATPDNLDSKEYLRQLVEEKVSDRYENPKDEKVQERIEYELGIIQEMGFSDYFLIVSDFINWSKERGIVVGPGRGSAAAATAPR